MTTLKLTITGRRPSSGSPLVFLLTSLILLFFRQTSCFPVSDSQNLRQDLVAKYQLLVDAPPPSLHARPPQNIGGVFYPIGYGADPTGRNDSTEAIQTALNDAFSHLDYQNKELVVGVKDSGGAVIDLQGGSYLISQPITFPPSGGGNLLFKEGSIRATAQFPPDKYLLELFSPKSNLRVKYEDITIRDILFDSAFTGGGIRIVDSARIRITNSYFLNFTTQGILVQGGHEIYISTCFLGQRPNIGADANEKLFSGTGIELDSTDNIVSNTVLFSSQYGILIRTQSNLIIGVHTYNKMKQLGGVGIYLKSEAWYTRIQSCYFDFNSLVIEDPHYIQVTGNFFYGDANLILKSEYGEARGLSVAHNVFSGEGSAIVEVEGEFKGGIEQVVIEDNQVRNMTMKSTVAKMTVAGNGTRWVADFSRVLVFPDWVKNFQYWVMEKPGQRGRRPGWVRVTDVSKNVVVVESDEAIDAVVSVAVDQYNLLP